MTFGEAIEAAKRGERVQRVGWNGKGMWIALLRGVGEIGAVITVDLLDRGFMSAPVIHDFFVMYTAQRTLQPGWLASQADMLADDWQVVP